MKTRLCSRLLAILLFGTLCFGEAVAQSAYAWLELTSSRDLDKATAIASDISKLEPEVKIFRTILGSYAVVIGPLTAEAATEKIGYLDSVLSDNPEIDIQISNGFKYMEELPYSTFRVETSPNNQTEPNRVAQTPHAERIPKPIVDRNNSASEAEVQNLNNGVTKELMPVGEGPLNNKKITDDQALPERTSDGSATNVLTLNQAFEFAGIQENLEIQLGLKLLGFYGNLIDGILGSQSEQSIRDFQRSLGHEETGQLTDEQKAILSSETKRLIGFTQLRTAINRELGIRVAIPTGVLGSVEINNPYVKLTPNSHRNFNMVLFNSTGGPDGLNALHRGLLTHANIPDENSTITSNRFDIQYTNSDIHYHARARLFGDRVRGVIIFWSPDQDSWASPVAELVAHSVLESSAKVNLAVLEEKPARRQLEKVLRVSPLAEAKATLSGFYVNSDGLIVTSSDGLAECTQITADFDTEVRVQIMNDDMGFALLAAQKPIEPLASATFEARPSPPNSELILAGYSFGSASRRALISVGTNGQSTIPSPDEVNFVAQVSATPEDAGGPILNNSGLVVGMLTNKTPSGKILPPSHHIALSSVAIASNLADHNILFQSRTGDPVIELNTTSRHARDITVLVRCY